MNLPYFPLLLCFPDLLYLSFWLILISLSSYAVIVFVSISFLCISLFASNASYQFVDTHFWLTWIFKSLSFVFIFLLICSLVRLEVMNFQLSLYSPSNLACDVVGLIQSSSTGMLSLYSLISNSITKRAELSSFRAHWSWVSISRHFSQPESLRNLSIFVKFSSLFSTWIIVFAMLEHLVGLHQQVSNSGSKRGPVTKGLL